MSAMRKRQPPAGLALHEVPLVWMLLAYPSHRPETLMPFSDDELAELLGLTPDQAARRTPEFWDAVREFLAA